MKIGINSLKNIIKRRFTASGIIVVIVLSLAFVQNKGGAFCASIIKNESCGIIYGKVEYATSGPHNIYYKYLAWNGTSIDCQASRCETQTTFWNEP